MIKMESCWSLTCFLIVLALAEPSFAACRGLVEDVWVEKDRRHPGDLYSPHSPQNYPPCPVKWPSYTCNQICRWYLYGMYESDIHIKVMALDIEDSQDCSNDSLTLTGYQRGEKTDQDDDSREYDDYQYSSVILRLCGSIAPNETLVFKGYVEIEFRTDGQGTGSGFHLQYHQQYRRNKYDDEYDKRGYIQSWGVVVITLIVVVAVVLAVVVTATCYCKRHQKNNARFDNLSSIVTTGDVVASAPPAEVKLGHAQYLGKSGHM